MQGNKRTSRRWLTAAVLAIGITIGVAMTATPAVGHVSGWVHNWNRHIKPRADARYYRKALADARYYNVGETAANADNVDGLDSTAFVRADAGAFAGVHGDGTLFTPATLQKNISSGNVQRTGVGVYCFVDLPFTVRSAMATGANGFSANFTVASVEINGRDGGAFADCPANTQARVRTIVVPSGGAYSPSALADAAFYVWLQ